MRAALLYEIGAVLSLAGAAAAWAAPHFGVAAVSADPVFLLAGGGGAFAFGAVVVRAHPTLAPDPRLRQGVAPRAFWTLFVGVVLVALFGRTADPVAQRFAASAGLAGMLMEAAAFGMLLWGAYGPKPTPEPPQPEPPNPPAP